MIPISKTELNRLRAIYPNQNKKTPADLALHPFDLEEVRLLDGPFKEAQDLHAQVLRKYEPDRLLAWFRKEAALKPKAKVYGGWESQTIAGHSLGHYLSGCALMYASTGDEEFKRRVDYIVSELAACQKADGDGYIGAFKNGKKILVEEVAKGTIRSKGFDLNGLWVPFYTQHKIYNGLRDAYRLCNNQEALLVEAKFADWLESVVGHLSDGQMQRILACEHGGMNESLADLFADTGEGRYLTLAREFYHKEVLEPLSRDIDCLPGKHANTQVPKLVGLARLYELTGNELDRKTAEFFWERVVNHHSYVTGGHCVDEHFGPPDKLNGRLGTHTTETCNVYNMLKLSRHLIQWGRLADVGDFYERALFNHIFATQHPIDGRVIYNLTLEMGGHKIYQDPFGFTCCVGTGMENHAKYGDSIYFHGEDYLYVNLFIASALNWKDKGLVVRQETNFPDKDSTTLTFTCQQPTELAIQYRRPYWAQQGVFVSVNGIEQKADIEPGQLSQIRRTWHTGDRLTIRIPMSLRLETMPDNKNRVAIMYGPLVLAGDLGGVEDPKAGQPDYVPVLITKDREPSLWIKPVADKPNTFKMINVGHPRNVTLIPFYRMHDRRYSIYWDMYTPQQWKQVEKVRQQALEEQKKLEAITVDFVQPGEMQPERDHNMQGERTSTGHYRGRKWRHAQNGWFSFAMKVDPERSNELICTYWGGETGKRTFDILVDDKKIATQTLLNNRPGKFWDQVYQIPTELTRVKQRVVIKLQAHPDNTAGGLFGMRIIRTKDITMTMVSPDSRIQLFLNNENGQILLSQVFNGETLLAESSLGLMVDGSDLSKTSTIHAIEKSSFDETWQTINGKNKQIRNYFNEYRLFCRSNGSPALEYQIFFRCYNDGFAYRYLFPKQTSINRLTFAGEQTELNFSSRYVWWAYNGEHHNVGPVSSLDTTPRTIRCPLVLKFETGAYMALLEGEILNYAPFNLKTLGKQNAVKFEWPPTVDRLPLKTSWRTFVIGKRPGDLVESNLLVNLNEPCKIEDPSWIKPGKTLWDWRTMGYTAADGFQYMMNTISHKRLIDFASQNNIQYLLMDANWYGAEFDREANPTTAKTGVDIAENMAYAQRKGVGIILYLNDVGAKQFGLERVLKQFAAWGAVGVKYGFMGGTWEEKVKQTRKVVELCAKYRLMVNFHDNPVPPSGDRRTWPNLLTKEFCQARADGPEPCYPETVVTSPFVNMIAGPLDYSDGWFDLNNAHHRSKTPYQLPGTVVAEVAKLIVAYTGWAVLPDCPEEYLKKEDLFECIRRMPLPFDSFKVLDGQIGEFISVARQAGEDWFIGSLTNRNARTIEIDFSFLPAGISFRATFYEDDEDSHFLRNKEAYKIRTMSVDSSSRIKIKMGAGGGHAIFLDASV